jgi:hypothetical protein
MPHDNGILSAGSCAATVTGSKESTCPTCNAAALCQFEIWAGSAPVGSECKHSICFIVHSSTMSFGPDRIPGLKLSPSWSIFCLFLIKHLMGMVVDTRLCITVGRNPPNSPGIPWKVVSKKRNGISFS